MKTKKTNYLTYISGIALIALILLLIYIMKIYFDLSALQKHYDPEQNDIEYAYHCAFITDSSSADFWDSVYTSAHEQGLQDGIYIENFGKDLSVSYSLDKLLKMAIAAKVDAILVEPSGNFSSTYLMNSAVEAGIAVGTLYRDEIKSNRFNYTGVNSVSMGYEYGELAISHSADHDDSFIVLLNDEENSTERRLLASGIDNALSEQRPAAHLDTMLLNEKNAFDAEENIRQFLKEYHDTVDVIICTTLLQTQYVSQLTIDMNYVGDFTIIGSYQNASVLEALKNGVISASLVVDTEQMGRKAASNLSEYFTYGHVSDYSQVDAYTITPKDAARILSAQATSENGGADDED